MSLVIDLREWCMAAGSRPPSTRRVAIHPDLEGRILDRLLLETRRVAGHYPAIYFPDGEKGQPGYRTLSGLVFVECANKTRNNDPWRGRTAFVTVVAEHFDDGQVRYHVFTSRYSILRTLLKRTYHDNLPQHPDAMRAALVYREVRSEVRKRAEPSWRNGREVWGHVKLHSIGSPPPRHQLLAELAGSGANSLGERIDFLLGRGGPMEISTIVGLLDGAGFRADTQVSAWMDAIFPMERVNSDLIVELRAVCASMPVPERLLYLALAQGRSYDDLARQYPEMFPTRVAASRVAKRLSDRFLARFGTSTDATTERPLTLLKLILEILLEDAAVHKSGDDRGRGDA